MNKYYKGVKVLSNTKNPFVQLRAFVSLWQKQKLAI